MPHSPELPESLASEAEDVDPRSSKRWSTAERMASVGRLAAGVAHEINNPLAYVLGSVELIERALAEIGELDSGAARTEEIIFGAQAALSNAKDGVERIRSIVKTSPPFRGPCRTRVVPSISRPCSSRP